MSVPSVMFVVVARRRVPLVRWLQALLLALVLVAGLLVVPPFAGAAPAPSKPALPAESSVPVSTVAGRSPVAFDSDRLPRASAGSPAWPAGGAAAVAVDTTSVGAARSSVPTAGGGPGTARVGGLPVRVRKQGVDPGDVRADPKAEAQAAAAAGPARVQLSVADRSVTDRAKINGVVFTVVRDDTDPAAGRVAVDLDYSGFATAYGGDFGGRLQLVQLPGCVLTTPERAECQVPRPVAGAKNVSAARVVSADALEIAGAGGATFSAPGGSSGDTVAASGTTDTAGGTVAAGRSAGAGSSTADSSPRSSVLSGQPVYALMAGPSSGAGDFTASSLSPTYAWAAGSQGGEFSYSIPLTMPPGMGGPVPDVKLGYSSASVDGRTVATSGQTSWVGEGWDYNPGYIEQSFRSCKDDGAVNQDLCWFTAADGTPGGSPVFTMAFGGHSGRMVRDSGGKWHLESDDGSRIELLTDASLGNGDTLGRYWKVTTQDGTQYFFGRHKRYAGDPQVTNSAQNVLVYGNNPGEPCYNAVHDYWSGCDMTFRWNLDYVIDPRDNTMTYFYTKFQGKYGNWSGNDTHVYDVTVTLDHIDYGTRAGSEAIGSAPMRANFTVIGRCLTEPCANNAPNWPDTPWDLYCPVQAVSCGAQTPSFWNPYRLYTVTSQVWNASTSAYRSVDEYRLTHAFPGTGGDGSPPSLWFDYFDHTGLDGGSLASPQLHFGGNLKANLVTATTPAYPHIRIEGISTGFGAQTVVEYSPVECTVGSVAALPWDTNPYRCYPQYNGSGWSWYHKYVAVKVTDQDLLGGGPDEVTSYAYSTAGSSTNVLWHYDSSEGSPQPQRSWTDFAGYSTVTTTHGVTTGQQSVSKTLYYRGMHGDPVGGGGFRTVNITDSNYPPLSDLQGLRGTVRESQTLDGATILDKTIHVPSVVDIPTATRSDTWPVLNVTARRIREVDTEHASRLSNGLNRWTRVSHEYEATYGLETKVIDSGDIAVSGDETCTTNTYVTPNLTKWMVNYAAQAVTTNCAATPTAADYLVGNQMFYDTATNHSTAPTKGQVTKTTKLSSVTGSTLNWTQASRADYTDPYGRMTDGWDDLERHATTSYTPINSGPLLQTTSVNALGHSSTTTVNPGRGTTTATADPNGKNTALQYDPLGRLTKVYKPHSASTVSYAASTATSTFTDITDTGTPIALTGDDTHTQVTLPFAFTFYGQPYTQAWLSSNGMLSFTGQHADFDAVPLPDPNLPNAAIYPFWDDLILDGQSVVSSKVTGTAPNRQFTVEWYQAYLYGQATRVTFTVTLHENGSIVFNYTGIDANGHDQGSGAGVGIENGTGGAATQFAYHQTLLATNKAITFTPSSAPATTLPDIEYTYTLRNSGGPNAIATKVLGPNGNQITSWTLYDGRLRLRQTQSAAPQANGGRLITDNVYDNRGLLTQTAAFWNNASGPTDTLLSYDVNLVANVQQYVYDNPGRRTVSKAKNAAGTFWQTVVGYNGEQTTMTPPAGGTATMTIVNAHGETTALRQYLSSTPTGTYQSTSYGYDRLHRLVSTTDPAELTWSSHYDLEGRLDSSTDPDKGTTTIAYNGDLTTVTDVGRNISLTSKVDALGRVTAVHDGTGTGGFKRIAKTYDSPVKGTVTSSTRYVGTDAFTTTYSNYDDGYRPQTAATTIPSSLALPWLPAGTYTVSSTYNLDGSAATTTFPATGGLAAETVTSSYDNTGRPLTLAGPDGTYVAGTSYYSYGAVYQTLSGSAGKRVRQTNAFEEATGRLTTSSIDTEGSPNTWVEKLTERYGYDPAGNVKNVTETAGAATVSNQCFSYDGLRQLTEAWTTTAGTCQANPSTGVVGGPDPYWITYGYDNLTGNRATERRHALTGADTLRTYTYPATGKRHALSYVTASEGGTGTDSYTYDPAGNTLTRNIVGKPAQVLSWDEEGHLATVTDSGGVSSYIYDADGNRLAAKDPAGATVYLPGFELRKVGSTVTCTRYIGSSTRTPAGLTWIGADHHGTGQLAIDAATLTSTRRKTDPFGNPRGTDPTWPNPHGFVGGVRDTTGLTHLGAREYEPNAGRFISDDPVSDVSDPQQLNGYAYAGNNPVTAADPTGLRTCTGPEDCGGDPSNGNSTISDETFIKMANDQREKKKKKNPSTEDVEKAKKLKEKTVLDVVLEVGGQILLDVLGITDIINCFTKGDLLACASTIIDFVPFGQIAKVGKVVKAAIKVGKAILGWIQDVKWAKRILTSADEAAAAAEAPLLQLDDLAGTVATSCRRHSFDPDTPVLMADGSRKDIKDIKVGDTVLATDPNTDHNEAKRVTRLHNNVDADLVDVTLAGPDGAAVIQTTSAHPFWNETIQQWTAAMHLAVGDQLHAADGTTHTVVAVEVRVGTQEMRDLTVADIHTYYVLAGTTPVLVHNCQGVSDAEQIEDHVKPRHTAGGDEADETSSLFDNDVDLGDLASRTEGRIGTAQATTGRVRYVIDAGRIIGTDLTGRATSIYTVVRSQGHQLGGDYMYEFNELVTMHPGLPRDLIG